MNLAYKTISTTESVLEWMTVGFLGILMLLLIVILAGTVIFLCVGLYKMTKGDS